MKSEISLRNKENTCYVKCGDNFYYECPFCHEEHIVTNENYSYHIFEKNIEIQEICENCGSTLFLESGVM